MVYAKRLAGTTLLGVAAGVMCWQGGVRVRIVYNAAMVAGTIPESPFIGFVIRNLGVALAVSGTRPLCWRARIVADGDISPDVRGAIMLTLSAPLGRVDRADRHQGAQAPMRQGKYVGWAGPRPTC